MKAMRSQIFNFMTLCAHHAVRLSRHEANGGKEVKSSVCMRCCHIARGSIKFK